MGIQWDTTTEGTPRRSHHGTIQAKTKTAREPGRILIRKLDLSTSKKNIMALFAKFGPLTDNNMPTNRLTKNTGLAFVTFKTAEQAKQNKIPGQDISHDTLQG